MSLLPAFMQKVQELNNAMENKLPGYSYYNERYAPDYAKVEALLADPAVEVNFDFYGVALPINVMLKIKDRTLARLFLSCPRIDWLAKTWNRNSQKLQQDYGIKYVLKLDDQRYLDKEKEKVQTIWSRFYYLDDKFSEACPFESVEIYEKMIAQLVEAAGDEDRTPLLFKTCNSLTAFKIALQYCPGFQVNSTGNRLLLSETKSFEVAKLLIEMGADVNAIDANELTPAMTQAKKHINLRFSNRNQSEHKKILTLLVERGARIDYINSSGESIFTMYADWSANYLDYFELPEAVFRAALKNSWLLSARCVFKKYPQYKKIYQEDIAFNILTVFKHEHYDPDYFPGLRELKNSEFLQMIKHMMKDGRFTSFITDAFNYNHEVVTKFANDLLHVALKQELASSAQKLLDIYHADPNYERKGKVPLFVANSVFEMIILLKSRADPAIKCEGRLFFEREGFLEGCESIDVSFFQLLESSGFDVFKPGEKTGKSLIQSLPPEAEISLFFRKIGSVSVPISKVTPEGMKIICRQSSKDYFTPLDDEGNTMLHYLATEYSAFSNVFRKFTPSHLKQFKNKNGKSPYDVVLAIDPRFRNGRHVHDEAEFRVYLNDYFAIHGDAYFTQNGETLLKVALTSEHIYDKPNWSLAKYLIDERGISLNTIIGYEALGKIIYICCREKEVLTFMLEHGYQPDDSALNAIMRNFHEPEFSRSDSSSSEDSESDLSFGTDDSED